MPRNEESVPDAVNNGTFEVSHHLGVVVVLGIVSRLSVLHLVISTDLDVVTRHASHLSVNDHEL